MADKEAIQKSVDVIDRIIIHTDAETPADIIANIMHWCDANKEDFDVLVQRGTCYYIEEA